MNKDEALTLYEDKMSFRNLSPKTIKMYKFYLSKFKYSEADMLEALNLERSTYYDRKKEAILVFGLALWGTVLPKLSMMLRQVTGKAD